MKKAALITLLTLSLLTLISFIGDNKTESIEINKKLLNELYYENENDAFFYSSNTYDVVTNQINLYAINWLTKMNDIINVNYSEKFTSYIDKYYTSNDLNLSIKNKIDLINFNNMLSVRKFFFGNIEEKSYYIDILRNACTEEQWLYLQSDNFEDKVFKTQVLYLALQNFDVLEQIPDIIKSNMIVYLKSFLNNPNNNFAIFDFIR
ncbi:MAG: hypothetical protein K0R54_6007 [Clostridiaceae bacterium]|nr:hypothetical protein [Clostridiaceae bacterium]